MRKGDPDMWKDVDPEIVRHIMINERNEAQKKFWAQFLLWIIIVFVWFNGATAGGSIFDHDWRSEGFPIVISVALLAIIIWTVVYEYFRRVKPVRDARYMMTSTCQGRERMRAKWTTSINQEYFISYLRHDNRKSGWVKTTPDFYHRCTIGTPVLIITQDQAEVEQMIALDPTRFDLDV